jgi:hypothetical protein
MQITIDLPEALQQSLLSQAAQAQTTPEQLIQYLHPTTTSTDADQLLSLIGTLELGTTDLSENHDQYIGEALHQKLHNAE